jgi:hypothetical protein
MKHRNYLLFLLLLGGSLLYGCMEKLGQKITAGVMQELATVRPDSTVKALSRQASQEVMDVLLSDQVQRRLRVQLDSVGQVLDRQVTASTVRLRDSLLSAYTSVWFQRRMREAGAEMQGQAMVLLDDVRGEKTVQFMARVRDELLNDSTLRRAAVFRNELLGGQTQLLLDSIVQKIANNLVKNQFRPETERLRAELDQEIKEGQRLALLIGGVALALALVAGWVYLTARRHKNTLKVITREIDKIPDQKAYDQLVGSIRKETQAQGLEPHLQAILKEENLYQQPQWQNKDYQVLHLIANHLKPGEARKTGADIWQEILEDARKSNLDEHFVSVLSRPQSNNISPEPVEA